MSGGSEVIVISENVRLDKRARSTKWQARVKLASGEWHRFSTQTNDVEKATEAALKFCYTADDRLKNNLPQSTRKFKRVAEFARDRMQAELNAGGGKVSYKDYIAAIDRYMIPFFGKWDIGSINLAALKQYDEWRAKKMRRQPAHSTINTHNTAFGRIFDEAEGRGWITGSIRPTLFNKGKKANSRGSFSKDEYEFIYKNLRNWPDKTQNAKARETREVLRNYVLFLANTGVRHGTEAMGLKWKHISWITEGDQRYLSIYVSGKTGGRELIARDRTEQFLDRQREMNDKLRHFTFEELLNAKLDDWVFKTRSFGKVDFFNLVRNFKQFLDENNLAIGSDGKVRTLYSFRHFYATLDLQRGISTHVLSRQLGNSTAMLDRFYSKLSPRMNASLHSGRDAQNALNAKNDSADSSKDPRKPKKSTTTKEQAVKRDITESIPLVDKAFDLFDLEKLPEAALLAALGTNKPDYVVLETATMRALTSFEAGRLSEAGLMKVLGSTN